MAVGILLEGPDFPEHRHQLGISTIRKTSVRLGVEGNSCIHTFWRISTLPG